MKDLLADMWLQWNENRSVADSPEQMREEHLVLSKAETQAVHEHHGARTGLPRPMLRDMENIPKGGLLSSRVRDRAWIKLTQAHRALIWSRSTATRTVSADKSCLMRHQRTRRTAAMLQRQDRG
jgi:hypothetical protein